MARKPHPLSNEIEDRVNKGLKNYWYPVLASWAVHDTPVGITRLSENIVLWRDAEGQVKAIEDRCPHRGARLSLGWNLGDSVACWYHGVEVNGEGMVENVPAVETCPMEGKVCLRSYPVQERAGAIFLYFGDEQNPEPCELQLPEQISDDRYSSFLATAAWKCNYRYAVDNVMDPMHGAYLHAVSHSMAEGDKQAEMKLTDTDTGMMFAKTGQMGVNFDWVEIGDTGALWLRLAIPYQQKFGPGGPFGIVGFATPVDEHNTQVFFWRTRDVQGWQRNVWRFLYRTRLEGLHWNVLEQDRILLEEMPDDARNSEMLYQHDLGLSRVRRLLHSKARDQIEALHPEAAE